MKRLILFLFLCSTAFGATITDTLKDAQGNALANTDVTFTYERSAFVEGGTVFVPGAVRVRSDAAGLFTVSLRQGSWLVSARGISFYIAVPATDGPFTLAQCTPRLTAFTSVVAGSGVTLATNGTEITIASPGGAAGISSLTGDVVATGPGAASATIPTNSVTRSKLFQFTASELKTLVSNEGSGVGDVLFEDEPAIVSPTISGTAEVDQMRVNSVRPNRLNLGTVGAGGTATLDVSYIKFRLTGTGATLSINVPTNMPDCEVTILGTSSSDLEEQVITLSNAAVRSSQHPSNTTNKFTIDAGTAVKYAVWLNIESGVIERFDVVGDQFNPLSLAANVIFSPTAEISSATVQAALAELGTEKAAIAALDDSAFDGDYGKLSNTPSVISQAEADAGAATTGRLISAEVFADATRTHSSLDYINVIGAGTAYTLTATPALVDMGTTDPSLTLTNSGIWRLEGLANVRYVGATFAANQTVTVKLRRTNNTAADLTGATHTRDLEVVTTFTGPAGQLVIPPVYYSTANANDIIQVFSSVSATPSAGSMTVDQVSISALRIAPVASDASAPTLTSATIDSTGTNMFLVFNEPVVFGAGGNDGFTLQPSGGASAETFDSGAGTDTLLYTLARTIQQGETATLDFSDSNGVEDVAGNDLANFTGTAVTNNSTQNSETLQQTIGSDTVNLALGSSSIRAYIGGTFTTGSAYHLTRVEFKLNANGSPVGTISCRLYATSGGLETTLIETSGVTLDASTVPASPSTVYSFTFNQNLSNGVEYGIVLSTDTIDGTNHVRIRHSSSGEYQRSSDGTTWVNVTGFTPFVTIYGY